MLQLNRCGRSVDRFGQQVRRMNRYGYPDTQKMEEFTTEKVKEKIMTLSQIKSEEEEDLIVWKLPDDSQWCIGNRAYHKVILASPVMIAMLMKEYELAEKLMNAGYWVNDLYLPDQIYMEIDDGENYYVPISITQLLMAWDDIPQKLFERICNEIGSGCFSYKSDYWDNPFMESEECERGKELLPPMKGLERIWNYDREMLRDMLDSMEYMFCIERIPNDFKLWKILVAKLLHYFAGMSEEMRIILESLSPKNMKGIKGAEKREAIKFWLQTVPKMKELCMDDPECQRALMRHLFNFYGDMESELSGSSKQDKERINKKFLKCLIECCPEWYAAEYYIEDQMNDESWDSYAGKLRLWKYGMEKSTKIDKMDERFWMVLQKLFGKKNDKDEVDDTDEYYDDDYMREMRKYNTDVRIIESIHFIDLFDFSDWVYNADNQEENSMMAWLFDALADLGSEELLLTCLKNNLIPKEVIPVLIKGALTFDKKKLLPCLMGYGYKKA